MDKVIVNKKELVNILIKNRDKHATEYQEALGGFYIQAQIDLEKKLAKVKEGKKFSIYFENLKQPRSYIKEYNDVINMLGVTPASEVNISMEDYLKYYKNEWDWCASWKASNNSYVTLYNVAGVGRIDVIDD